MNKVHKFTFSLERLSLLVNEKIRFLKRDMDVFKKYGFTLDWSNELKVRVEFFDKLPTDAELAGDMMIATEKKNVLAIEIRSAIDDVMIRVQDKFGHRSPYYNKFCATTWSKLSDERLLSAARRVVRISVMYMDELKETGFSNTQVEALKKLANNFEIAIGNKEDAFSDREIGTETRVHTANEIYTSARRFCETGKRIWKVANEAKYNDYLIYKTNKRKVNIK